MKNFNILNFKFIYWVLFCFCFFGKGEVGAQFHSSRPTEYFIKEICPLTRGSTCHHVAKLVFEKTTGKIAPFKNEFGFFVDSKESFQEFRRDILADKNSENMYHLDFYENNAKIHSFAIEKLDEGFRIHQSFVAVFDYVEWLTGVINPHFSRAMLENKLAEMNPDDDDNLDCYLNFKNILETIKEADKFVPEVIDRYGKGKILTQNELTEYLDTLEELLTVSLENTNLNRKNQLSIELFAVPIWTENNNRKIVMQRHFNPEANPHPNLVIKKAKLLPF